MDTPTRKQIPVRFMDDEVHSYDAVVFVAPTCTGYGNSKCVKEGEHSWFNHSMDIYFSHPSLSNAPENNQNNPF